MIDITIPLEERDELEVIELLYYKSRIENDLLIRTMEQLQAAGAAIIELSEVETQNYGEVMSLTISSASSAIRTAYSQLESILHSHIQTTKGLRAYLELLQVELAESMIELQSASAHTTTEEEI